MKRILLLVMFLLLALAATLAVVRNRAAAVSPAILSFTATPQEIRRGESVQLDWSTEGVPTLALAWGPENGLRNNMQKREGLAPSGTMTFQPQEDTIYVLECETRPVLGCSASASVRVR